MRKLIYKNELGAEVEFSASSNFILNSISESVKNKVVSVPNVGQDGERYILSRLDTRDVRLKVTILNRTGANALVDKIQKVLNPKLKGELFYIDETTTRKLDVVLDEIPYPNEFMGHIEYDIDMVATNPYWKGMEVIEALAITNPTFAFPHRLGRNQVIFGRKTDITESEINNMGDVETGFRIVFKCKGSCSNVEVFNVASNKKIRVLGNFVNGDVIEIVSTPFKKFISINGRRAFDKLDLYSSSFFFLNSGKNIVGYRSDSNTMNLEVILYYVPLFLGR